MKIKDFCQIKNKTKQNKIKRDQCVQKKLQQMNWYVVLGRQAGSEREQGTRDSANNSRNTSIATAFTMNESIFFFC